MLLIGDYTQKKTQTVVILFLAARNFKKKRVCHQTLSLCVCVCVCVCVCSLSLSASIPSAIIVLIPAHSVVDEDGKTGQKLLTKYYSLVVSGLLSILT